MVIDVLRGSCIVMMITGHVGTATHLNHGVHFLRFVSGAEGFVFLAGLVMGLVYRRKMEAGPVLTAYRAIWKRAATIWLVHCALVVLAVAGNGGLYHHADIPPISDLGVTSFLALTATLRFQPGHALNILPLYVFLLGAAPLVLEMLRRRLSLVVLALSIGTLVAMQYVPSLGAWTHESSGHGDAFPVLSWQGLFVPGLVIGYHYHRLRKAVVAPHRRVLLYGSAGLCLAFIIASWIQTPFELYNHARWDSILFERHPLRLGRVVYFFVAVLAFYLIVQEALRRQSPLNPALDAMALLGRNSLYAFLTHIVIGLPLTAIFSPSAGGVASEVVTALTVACIYLLARYQVGRPWIPN